MANFPKNAGKTIPNSVAAAECEAYQKKYPDRPAGFSLNKGELMSGIQRAEKDGATAIGILNCLNNGNYYIGVGYVTEDGKWVDKNEQVVEDFKSFKAKHPDETAGYFWGVDYATPWIKAQGGTVEFSNAIDENGTNTLCGPSDFEGGKDNGSGTPNGPLLCPTECPGDD